MMSFLVGRWVSFPTHTQTVERELRVEILVYSSKQMRGRMEERERETVDGQKWKQEKWNS